MNDYKVVNLIFNGERYPLKNVFLAASVSDRIFDEWYLRVNTDIVIDGCDVNCFTLLKSFLDGETSKTRVSPDDIVRLSVEWETESLFKLCVIDSASWIIDAINSLRERGLSNSFLEEELSKRFVKGDFGGIEKLPRRAEQCLFLLYTDDVNSKSDNSDYK